MPLWQSSGDGYQATQVCPNEDFTQASALRVVGSGSRNRRELGVGGCELWRLPHFDDMRGITTRVLEGSPVCAVEIISRPWCAKPACQEHAHHICKQFLVAAHGQLAVVVDDGRRREELMLEDLTIGLLIPPMVWGIQYKFDCETVLLVLRSYKRPIIKADRCELMSKVADPHIGWAFDVQPR